MKIAVVKGKSVLEISFAKLFTTVMLSACIASVSALNLHGYCFFHKHLMMPSIH
jgi:hypothetical protein